MRRRSRAQWREALNVRVELRQVDLDDPCKPTNHLGVYAYIGDYPDPDTFLRQPLAFYRWLTAETLGARYIQLVEDAVQVQNRAQRMSLSREADRILVADRVLVMPLDYGAKSWQFVLRSWVKGLLPTPAGEMTPLKQGWIEPH
jgi:ABC-type oligopeptide transport system substrate-binding subunit